MNPIRRLAANAFALALICVAQPNVHAAPISIDWVTVGDPNNAASTSGYGAVADPFRIMKFEFTNSQYQAFLNAVDPNGTNPYGLWNGFMEINTRGGIRRILGNPVGSRYEVRGNMGDKPVNLVSWFDAARVANWLHNGQGSGDTETGAYTLLGGQTTGNPVGRNTGATFYIPTENQWYKAAYYKGGSPNAGYWNYATQSDTLPTAVNATTIGTGTSGGVSPVTSGNFANWDKRADWNNQDGNVTTVGTNGGPSAYGAFDMNGNISEWNDLTGDIEGIAALSRSNKGGQWDSIASDLGSLWGSIQTGPNSSSYSLGFRLASPVPVPEPSTWVMGAVGFACAGWGAWRRRKRACHKPPPRSAPGRGPFRTRSGRGLTRHLPL
jgi:formylglycine-generating enzyme